MDAPRIAVRLGAMVAVAALLVVLGYSLVDGGPSARAALLTAADGSPFVLNRTNGSIQWAQWEHLPVIVIVTTEARLNGVDELRGAGEASESLDLGNGLRVFALSAKSTHLGCTVGWNSALGASKDIADYDGDGVNDGRILDPCGQGQWDAFHKATPVPGTPAPRRLPALELEFRRGDLWGLGYDGPVGPA